MLKKRKREIALLKHLGKKSKLTGKKSKLEIKLNPVLKISFKKEAVN